MEARRRIGEKVRGMRKERDWTQRELAERAGVEMQTVSNLEVGRFDPRISTLDKLAVALGAELADLV